MKAIGRNESRKEGATTAGTIRVRRKINPASPPTTVEINGIRVHFPFKPYACQEKYMEKVLDALFRSENALLESPTGTGKTLCLLCATLAWQRQQQRNLREAADLGGTTGSSTTTALLASQDGPQKAARLPQIIYASRTHSQLSQVVRELRNTRYRPPHAVLASREQMCVNPKVKKKESTASDINHDCNKLGKERKCRYRNNLDGFTAPASEQQCAGSGHQAVLDMEELIVMGKERSVCPFYYTRAQVENAELILVPYNYLFDKDARETTLADVRWENAVVIFDEAHNLESFASDSASFDLSNTDIAGCMKEVERATNYLSSMPDLNYNLKSDNLALLTRAFERLEKYIMELGPRTAYGGEYMMEIFKQGAGITHANHLLFIEELRKVNDMIMDLRGTGATRGSPRLEHFATCLKRVYGHKLEARCMAKASSYRVHVSPKTKTIAGKNESRTVSYWCFAPSVAMEELSNLNVRSILVTSGTLSPLPSYSMELGIPFPITLENPHIIQEDQVHVRVIGKGVSGKLLSSSYERRQNAEYFSELGNTLASLSKVIPAGMLIFFPSYGVMETCVERWGGPSLSRPKKPSGDNFFAQRGRKPNASKQYAFPRVVPTYNTSAFGTSASSPWKRLLAAKAIVVEPRASADLSDAISEFKRFLEMPKSSGCVLMGVCRGKISEGIDFAHDMSRAVIITGIPFAPSFDAKVKMKREFLDCARAAAVVKPVGGAGFSGEMQDSGGNPASKLSGNEWYSQQAHRAVNQAIGRVIRNQSDYGAVLLLDSRFDQPRNKEGLSRWVRPHVRSDEGFGAAIKALGTFYREAAAQAKVRAAAKPAPVEVAYENEKLSDDDSVGNIHRVALVTTRQKQKGETDEAPDDGAYVAPDRVVARLEVDAIASKPLKAPRIVRKSVGAQNFDAVFDSKKAATASSVSQQKPDRNPALIFMNKTRSLMSLKDQSTIRKLIHIMRRQGDAKDIRGYRKSASEIITLVLQAEKHESPPVLRDERMLFLFLELVPEAYRADFQLVALPSIVEFSEFGQHCKENLVSPDCSRLFTSAVAVLQLLWFTENASESSFAQHAQVVLSIMYKAERVAAQTMLLSFLKLLQKDYHEITRRLFDDLHNTKMIERRKRQQRNRIAESSIDMNRFLPATTVNKRAFGRFDGRKSENETAIAADKPKAHGEPANASSGANSKGVKRALVNPYKRPKTKPVQSNTAKPASVPASATTNGSKTKALKISDLLKSVESDPYVGHNNKKATGAAAIDSNASPNSTCDFCFEAMPKPIVAECGHVACSSCWNSWLKRSHTCLKCRKPMEPSTIALLVYQDKKDGPAVPTQQAKQQQQQEEDDSDGELVLY